MRNIHPVDNAVDHMDATHYPTRNLGDTGWNHRYPVDPAWTKPEVSAPEPTRRTPLQRPLNPQVSGSNPEGRTRKTRSGQFSSLRVSRREMRKLPRYALRPPNLPVLPQMVQWAGTTSNRCRPRIRYM